MKSTNAVYTVTPPDFRLTHQGISVLLLGVKMETIQSYATVYDKIFPDTELTFYTSEEGINAENVAWYRATAGMSSSVFVNLDNISGEEIFLAMQAETSGTAIVYWVSLTDANPGMVQLLNSYQYHVYGSFDEIEDFLDKEYGKKD